MPDSTIPTDVQESTGTTVSDAAAAFEALLDAGDGTEETGETGEDTEDNIGDARDETVEDASDDDHDDAGEDEGDDGDGDEAALEPKDEATVTLKVNGEEVTATVGDLKRLYGQEAALTQRSQEVAQSRKDVDLQREQFAHGLEFMASTAQQRWNTFAGLDFRALSREMEPAEFDALVKDALEARQHAAFFGQSFDQFRTQRSAEVQKLTAELREKADREHVDMASPHYIPDYTPELRKDLVSFAVRHGVDEAVAEADASPSSLKLLWMAQQYESLKAKAEQRRQAAPKKAARQTPSKRVPANRNRDTSNRKSSAALDQHRKLGTVDSAAAAFLDRMA